MKTTIDKWARRLAALFDLSAWMLIAPAFAALYAIDAPSAMTLAQWSLFALVLAGVAVVISRIVFPQIHLTKWLTEASRDNSTAAGLVVAALVMFVGIVMLTLAIWAKP